jgi:simple sugar transport system ATP-binding protein
MDRAGTAPLLALSGITKRYASVVANENISLTVRPGEIHAVLGENGAGKTTLMNLIFGVTQPDAGTIRWKGEAVRIESPAQARGLGISMVFQHFSLFERITVAENISLTVPGGLKELSRAIRHKGEEFGFPIDPSALVHDLSVGQRQWVEIIRCLLQEPALLILDEPTSVLPPPSIEHLFATLRRLADSGISILYISHKLEEICALCHRATILREGRVVDCVQPTAISVSELATMMIGREMPRASHPPPKQGGEVRLRVSGLSWRHPTPLAVPLTDVSFAVRAGEIIGVAGVAGNGQRSLTRLLSGEEVLSKVDKARIELAGVPVGHEGVARRRDLGLSLIPEERHGHGTVPSLTLADNALLTAHRSGMIAQGLIRRRLRDTYADRCIETMRVICTGRSATAASLSGGNLQKFIIGREILLAPKVLIVAQPTWGIDVGAAAAVRQKLIDLRDTGVAILVFSEDLEELFEISDRMVVMFMGRVSEPVNTRSVDIATLGRMMAGVVDAADPTVVEAAQ